MDYVDDYLFDGIRILLGEDGTVISDDGKPILQYVWGKYWVNNHAHILKASSIYSLEAIYIALSRTAIKHIVTGAVQMKISQRNLKNLRLTMPSPDEIYNLNDLFEMYRQNVEENKALEALRDSILPKLMSGEIDVSQVEVPMQPNNHFSRPACNFEKMIPSPPKKGIQMESAINNIMKRMRTVLSSSQLQRLVGVLREELNPMPKDDSELLSLFITAKKVEGCSPRTISYYESTIAAMSATVAKPYVLIESDDLRRYLNEYERSRGASKVTIDNIRRILSSFFSWLEDEDYIVKSPVRRIKRVKTATRAKEILQDEDLENIRDACSSIRDLALVDLLATTGMRVGELVGLNVADVNLQERECIVTGKGNKQRPVYFDARAKLHLQAYLDSRKDDCPALFVSLCGRASRLSIGTVEARLRELGKRSGVERVYPHKFRRTLATHAIDKGMPIEQVQKLLGHARIDTTMHYAMVNQNNVKASHRRYLE